MAVNKDKYTQILVTFTREQEDSGDHHCRPLKFLSLKPPAG